MANLVADTTGLIHLLSSIIALITGTAVLIMRKGSSSHIKMGYVYVGSMLILLVTAFMIYRLFGGFGVFHIAALVSVITLIFGMIPLWTRKGPWKYFHFSFMYWSVMGLYAAFASEVLTRVPETPFFGMVGIATAVIMGIGAFVFVKKKEDWVAIFS